MHGANRLASNSLLECVVCAYELADYLSFTNLETPKKIDKSIIETIELYSKPISETDYNVEYLKQNLKSLMWDNVGIIRTEEKLIEAKSLIEKMMLEFNRERKCLNKEEYEYRNMLTVARLIVDSAISRKESRGAHSRADYKVTSEIGIHSKIVKSDNKEPLLC